MLIIICKYEVYSLFSHTPVTVLNDMDYSQLVPWDKLTNFMNFVQIYKIQIVIF